jgi:hypothetical protein
MEVCFCLHVDNGEKLNMGNTKTQQQQNNTHKNDPRNSTL